MLLQIFDLELSVTLPPLDLQISKACPSCKPARCCCFLCLHGKAELHGYPGDGGTYASSRWLRKIWVTGFRVLRGVATFPRVCMLDGSGMEKLFYSFLALRHANPSWFVYASLKMNFPLCSASQVSCALLMVIKAEIPAAGAGKRYICSEPLWSVNLCGDQAWRGDGAGDEQGSCGRDGKGCTWGKSGKLWEKQHFLHMRLKKKKWSNRKVSSNLCLIPCQLNIDLFPHTTSVYSLVYYYFYGWQYMHFILDM